MMTSFVALFCCAAIQNQPQLKPPPSKSQEAAKFHAREVRGMPAATRMKGYEQRLQMEEDSLYMGLTWRNVGPEIQSGRVVDFDSPSKLPNELLVAYATGGLWRTKDDGISWEPLFDNESAFAIGDFAVSADGKTIWVGTGENNSQRTSYSGTGVFKSSDAGKNWKNMGLNETHRIGRVLIDPRNEDTVYVAAIGALYSKNEARGVYKTTDGGKSWSHILKTGDQTGVIDLAMDPKNPNTLYASAWDRDRRAWNFREAGPGSAIYKSIDAGKTWKVLENGVPKGEALGRAGIAVAPSKPNIVFAFVDNQGPDADTEFRDEFVPSGSLTLRRFLLLDDAKFLQLEQRVIDRFVNQNLGQPFTGEQVVKDIKEGKMSVAKIREEIEKKRPEAFEQDIHNGEVYRSEDYGATWKKINEGKLGLDTGYYFGRVIVDPKNPEHLFICALFLLESNDGGKTWKIAARNAHVDYHAVWIDPKNPQRIFVGNDGGTYMSLDGGANWRHLNGIPVGQFTTIAVDFARPYNIIGGLQDNGTMMGPSNYAPGRSDPWLWRDIGGGDGSAIAVDPRDNGQLYIASQFGDHSAYNSKTNERRDIRPSERGSQLRFNWISPILISPHHPDILYIGANKLFRSLDMGRTWESISPDLTKNSPNGDVPFSTIKELAESPFKFGQIYVGCDDGTVKMTRDHGNTWIDIATPTPDKWVSRVVASKWDPNTVYVCQTGYREDDFTPYIWMSTNNGKSWESISQGLPTEPVNVLREDPVRKEYLYVGTDLGVYFSPDKGKTWSPLGGNIPRTPVHDLVVHPRDGEIVIASHARSVFVLDAKPLQRLTDEVRAKSLYLYPPNDMTRSPNWGYERRTPYGPEPPEPRLKLQVWCPKGGKGVVRIKDSEGKVVKEEQADITKGFAYPTISLMLSPSKPHSIDLKNRKIERAEDALLDPFQEFRAQYLSPGNYTVEVEVNGEKVQDSWRLNVGTAGPGGRGRDDDS